MYRIIFNPKTAKWEIHLSFMIIFWRRVSGEEFTNFGDAQKRCYELGLDQVYKCWNQRPKLFQHTHESGPTHPTPVYSGPAVLRTRQIIAEDRGHGHNF